MAVDRFGLDLKEGDIVRFGGRFHSITNINDDHLTIRCLGNDMVQTIPSNQSTKTVDTYKHLHVGDQIFYTMLMKGYSGTIKSMDSSGYLYVSLRSGGTHETMYSRIRIRQHIHPEN